VTLWINYKNIGDPDRQWHVGETLRHPASQGVESVQAEGDELEYILNNFRNLPNAPACRVVKWFGEHAQFIVANLNG